MQIPKPMQARIAVYDSGFGGLTVLSALHDLLPDACYYYLGDAARMPYGSKSKETICRYALECGSFLQKLGADILVVACHTVSSVAVEVLTANLSIPVFGVVDPCIRALKASPSPGPVAILATEATIQSQIYQEALSSTHGNKDIITIACPLFAPIIEEGLAGSAIAQAAACHYLEHLQDLSISKAVLACTHYPLLSKEIQACLGKNCQLIDPAKQCAQTLQEFVIHHFKGTEIAHEKHKFFTTDDPLKFQKLSSRFLPKGIDQVQKATI